MGSGLFSLTKDFVRNSVWGSQRKADTGLGQGPAVECRPFRTTVNCLSRANGDYYIPSLPHPRRSLSSERNIQLQQAELNGHDSRPFFASEIGSAKRKGEFGTL